MQMQIEQLSVEIECAVRSDDGRAAKEHLAAGRVIYYGDQRHPGQIIKEFPDGRKQIVTIDDQNVVFVIREI